MIKIIIAGGGTGGHLFPGIALAQEIKARQPDAKILFLATRKRFDADQIARYGFVFYQLPSPRLSLSPKFAYNLIRSLYLSFKRIKEFRPSIVIGLGGYGAVSPLIMAKFLKVPVVMIEQNLLPGKVTRLFSAIAQEIYCQWAGTQRYFRIPKKIFITGSPLRTGIKRIDKTTARTKFNLSLDKNVLAIIGGSQGALALNQFVVNNISLLKQHNKDLGIIHLTGTKDYERIKRRVESARLDDYYVAAFSEEMNHIYSAADLVLCRAGGITIAELTALGLPAVLVPFPYATENHQFLNAHEVERSGAGILIKQKELSLQKMLFIIKQILLNPERLSLMTRQSQAMNRPQAARIITERLIRIAEIN